MESYRIFKHNLDIGDLENREYTVEKNGFSLQKILEVSSIQKYLSSTFLSKITVTAERIHEVEKFDLTTLGTSVETEWDEFLRITQDHEVILTEKDDISRNVVVESEKVIERGHYLITSEFVLSEAPGSHYLIDDFPDIDIEEFTVDLNELAEDESNNVERISVSGVDESVDEAEFSDSALGDNIVERAAGSGTLYQVRISTNYRGNNVKARINKRGRVKILRPVNFSNNNIISFVRDEVLPYAHN